MPNEIIEQKEKMPSEIIQLAIDKGADLDKLEKLLILRRMDMADKARQIFNASFVIAQNNIDKVVKTKLNPQTHSKYAPLEDIIKQSKPVYTKEGFAIIFYEGETSKNDHIRICADVLHREGHKETYYYDIPMDGVGIKGNANMTKIHGKSSSTSYARRYLMCMIWNIPTGDDNDAQSFTVQYITNEQKSELIDLINDKGIDISRFCKAFGIDEVEHLPANKFAQAKMSLVAKKGGVK